MSTTVAVIAGCAVVTYVIKGIGPLALGGRELPLWFTSVVILLAPALFAALVVTQALGDGERIAVGANTVGVAAGGVRRVALPLGDRVRRRGRRRDRAAAGDLTADGRVRPRRRRARRRRWRARARCRRP